MRTCLFAYARARVPGTLVLFIEEAEKDHPLLENFSDMTVEAICFWLSKFVVEARKGNGQD